LDYSRYKAIKVEKEGAVIVMYLNRPETFNAFDEELHSELEDILEDIGKDDEVKAAVLTGAGKAFSAGGDIKMMHRMLTEPSAAVSSTMSHTIRLINNIVDLEKPLIAAVNGDAIGLGATVALFSDIIIASEKARIGDPHVSVGLVAGDGGAVIWPLLVGIARAKEFLLTGDLVPAPEAWRMGLVNKVVPHDEVMPKAIAIAKRLAAGPTLAISWTKHSINTWLREMVNLILPTSIALEANSFRTEDHREAVTAFLEKRVPKFKGR